MNPTTNTKPTTIEPTAPGVGEPLPMPFWEDWGRLCLAMRAGLGIFTDTYPTHQKPRKELHR